MSENLIVSALGLAAIAMSLYCSHVLVNRKRLQEKLALAQADIAYLLAVEQAHCDKHLELSRATFKRRVRKEVTDSGLSWSGSFNATAAQRVPMTHIFPTTPAARMGMKTKQAVRVSRRTAQQTIKTLGRWLDLAMITVENGITKTLLSHLATKLGAA